MRISKPASAQAPIRLAPALIVFGCGLMLASCGPTSSSGGQASGQPAAPAPPPANTALDQLKTLLAPAGLTWDMADGVTVTPSADPAKATAQSVFTITPTTTNGLHRVGAEGNFGGGSKSYHINVWVKSVGKSDAMVEARGQTLISNSRPADYGRAFFDLVKTDLAPNKLSTPDTEFKTVTITTDGDWKKISADITTRDGWLYVDVGMVMQGQHAFTGAPGSGLVIGGIEVTPGPA
jgi:hypothetical protein